MFKAPEDDPWANKGAGVDDDDDWDTDPDFTNKQSIKKGTKEEIVSAAEAQRALRTDLDSEREKKFGLPRTVQEPSSTAAARNKFAQFQAPQEEYQPPARAAPVQRAAAPPPAAAKPPPAAKPAPAPAPKAAAPPPAPKPAAAPPPAAKPAPPPVAAKPTPPPPAAKPVAAPAPPPPAPEPEPEQSWDDGSGYDQGGYDQSGGYDQGGYDQGGYDQGAQGGGGGKQCRALYEFAGENSGDLPFYVGDVITVLDDTDPSGWWHGELNGTSGYFPSNFVELI